MPRLSGEDEHVVDLLLEVPAPNAASAAPLHLLPRLRAAQRILNSISSWSADDPPPGLRQRTLERIASQAAISEERAELVRPPAT